MLLNIFFFEVECKGQKKVERLKLLIFANLRPLLKVSLSVARNLKINGLASLAEMSCLHLISVT
jgi:hypothetical protein